MTVVVDERGVTRKTLLGSTTLAWHEIGDYRWTIKPRANRIPGLLMSDVMLGFQLGLAALDTELRLEEAHLELRLLAGPHELEIAGWWQNLRPTFEAILGPLHARLGASAAAELAREGSARFGPLVLSEAGVQWNDQPLLPADRVESIELFDESPLLLRVMAREKAFPHAKASTAKIPNLAAALDVAANLGYAVGGRPLLAALGAKSAS